MPNTKDPLKLARNALRIYGCTLEDAVALNEGLPLRTLGSRARIYADQRTKAAHRNIGWEISFPDWWQVWSESGHWHQRGVGKAGYCMARKGDVGPYKLGNVFIQASVENSRDGIKKRVEPCSHRSASALKSPESEFFFAEERLMTAHKSCGEMRDAV